MKETGGAFENPKHKGLTLNILYQLLNTNSYDLKAIKRRDYNIQ